jgi:hypothetical protein
MASFDELVAYYQRNAPPSRYEPFSGPWNDEYNQWLGTIMAENGYERYEDVPMALLDEYEIRGGDVDMPFEQALGNRVINDYVIPDLDADAGRQAEARQILSNYGQALDSSRQTLNDAVTVGPDGWTNLGSQELAMSNAATQEQLGFLQEQIAALSGSLDIDLQERAASLQTQLDTLRQGLDTFTEAERAALAQQLETNFNALETETTARRDALATELAGMGEAINAQEAARRAALQTEVDKLTAALEPMKAIRIQGAEALAASVNLGAQSERDRIMAEQARGGYIGGSTSTDAALARATINARQEAARGLISAQEANAGDDLSLARYAAGGERGISDDTTGLRFDADLYGVGQTRGLSDYDAQQRRGITDFGAGETRGIASRDAVNRLDFTRYGADQTRALGDYGTSERRGIRDMGATDTRGIRDAGSQRKFTLFSNDIARRLNALSAVPQAINTEFAMRDAADQYGQSGLRRSFDNLSFFNLGGGMAPTQATYQQGANTTTGEAFQNVGAGLVGIAGNIGQANQWWQKKPPATGGGDTGLNYV